MLNWTTTNASVQGQGIKMLAYGESGAGKTVLCATMPRPVIISAERGLLSLQRQNLERLYGVGNPNISYDTPVIPVTTVDQLAEAYQWFANPANKARQYFDSLCLDSVSDIAEVVLNNAKRSSKDPRQAYGELIEKMETHIRAFRDLDGFNVLMLSKMEPMKNADGVVRYSPSMPGTKLGPALPYFFDEVFHLGVNKTQDGKKYRYLRTDQDLQYVAKDRSGCLDEIERPEMWYVIEKIKGAVK